MPDMDQLLQRLVDDVTARTRAPGAPTATKQTHGLLTLVTVMVTVAAVVAGVAVSARLAFGNQGNNDHVSTIEAPDSTRLLTLAPEPLLPAFWAGRLHPNLQPTALSTCVSNPLTWGASDSFAGTYGKRHSGDGVANEYVLRFGSVAAAHHAVTQAWRQSTRCPGRRWDVNFWRAPTRGDRGDHLSEWFYNAHDIGGHPDPYMLRVGRRENIVVVVENTGNPEDIFDRTLWNAMYAATGHPWGRY